jgi:ferrous iron transport protein A
MNTTSKQSTAAMRLAGQPEGARLLIRSIQLSADVRHRLMEMGLMVGSECRVVRYAPLGDPMEIDVCGYSLAIRRTEARGIVVESLNP